MFHHGAGEKELESAQAVSFKTRLGLWMFLVYLAVYAGFVAINVIDPKLMTMQVALGLNLAVLYGFGLIVFALVMAMVYNHFCSMMEKRLNPDAGGN